jgi:molybdopterin-containing oxidoreductase family membrane subunit
MLEKALSGDKKYWSWIGFLMALILTGAGCYYLQLRDGMGVTGMSRDVSWGLYIAQFTFLVGVAASAVMVVLPYYLHDFKAFGKLTVLGEFVAVASVIMCLLFIVVDIGQPMRMINMIKNPSPNSILFWDMIVLNGYLVLNAVITRFTLQSEKTGLKPPQWIKWVILLSIPWAISIHTVTAFIYSGLAARPFWMTAVLAPRFLASAFAAGPALLILVCFILKRFTSFDAGRNAIDKLTTIATYAMLANIFFVLMEIFTAYYSGIPHHIEHFEYLYFGLHGHNELAPFMWVSALLAVIGAVLLLRQKTRDSTGLLSFACVAVIVSIWIEKGMGMVVTGFVPSPLGEITAYVPTLPELGITLGIYGVGMLLITGFYKIALSLRGEVA